MAYTINLTNGNSLITLADNTADSSRSVTFIGKNYANYGEIFNENFARLLENFNNNVAPTAPLEGQLWWNSALKSLRVWNGSAWQAIPVTSSITGTTNQVIVTQSGGSAITLSLPVDGSNNVQFPRLRLTQATGVAPLIVSSTTTVTNLSADLLDGQEGAYYLNYTNLTDRPTLGSISSQDAGAVSITGGIIADTTITDSTISSNNATITGGSITNITDLSIEDGGTGASTASDARANLGLGATDNVTINRLILNSTNPAIPIISVPTQEGGAIPALISNLNAEFLNNNSANYYLDYNNFINVPNLGTMSSQDDSTVAITGGTLSGVDIGLSTISSLTTPLTVANGGTGATTAAVAIDNLGGLPLTGGTMTGFVTLHANPTANLHAATKQYVDTKSAVGTIAAQNADAVTITGGSLTGVNLTNTTVTTLAAPLSILNGGTGATTAAAGISNLGGLPLSGGTMTGYVTLHADPSANFHASTKQYVDNKVATIALTPGPTGPQGVQGPQGPQGPQGVQGIQGPLAPLRIIAWAMVNSITGTLLSGSNLTVSRYGVGRYRFYLDSSIVVAPWTSYIPIVSLIGDGDANISTSPNINLISAGIVFQGSWGFDLNVTKTTSTWSGVGGTDDADSITYFTRAFSDTIASQTGESLIRVIIVR